LFEQKRQAVLSTAAELIRRRGYDRLSLTDVADQLHISSATVYYYFRNKADIFREILDLGISAFLSPDENPEDYPIAPSLTGAQCLERFLRRCARSICTEYGSCLLTMQRDLLDPDILADFTTRSRQADDLGRSILRMGIEDGTLAPCEVQPTYMMIIGALRFIGPMYFDQGVPMQTISDALVNLVMRGMTARPAPDAA
jgi:AcrR family transcriptional regulator